MNGRDAGAFYAAHADRLDEELADTARLGEELAAAREEVGREHQECARTLAKVMLPDLSDGALEQAERLSGFRALRQRNPRTAMARESTRLATRIQELEADERWTRREGLVGAHGVWTAELAEAEGFLASWQAECDTFESLPDFLELVQVGYDTPTFEERWWQPQYWRHWAAGDRICATLGLADFGDDVLPAYRKATEPRDKWAGEVGRIRAKVQGVHDLVKEHDQAVWRRDNLEAVYLEEAQQVLAEHLQKADEGLLATWADGDRAVLVHLKRLSGLAAKREFLAEMERGWVLPAVQGLSATQQKFRTKAVKLMRPKKWALDVPVPEGFHEKLAAQAQRRQKARDAIRRIRRYQDYERFDLAQPPETWWLHFQGGRRPGVFTPSLRAWYDRRPDLVLVTDAGWDEEVEPLAHAGVLAATGDIS